MRSVLVSHPHAAVVSIAVARAFERSARLAAFATGVAAADGSRSASTLRRLVHRWPHAGNRIIEGIGSPRLRAFPVVELLSRALAFVGPPSSRHRRTYDTMFRLHDAAVAGMAWPRGVDCVYAYEDAALRTFASASRAGIAKVLDVPAVHAANQERIWREEAKRWPAAADGTVFSEPAGKARRKADELALADVVCVASRHTQRTLEEAGVRKPIVVAPYGFPLDRFAPGPGRSKRPFTVISVGSHDLRKGTPYLLEAWKKADLKTARLRMVGPIRLAPRFVVGYSGGWEHLPHVPRSDIARIYRDADLLVFPTLGDGFGLVIQEAMCCGTPVLTTPFSGGPECIDDGVEGWIVSPRDVDAVVERLRWAAANRERLAEMGRAARRRAERYDELAAGRVLLDGLERALGRARPSA